MGADSLPAEDREDAAALLLLLLSPRLLKLLLRVELCRVVSHDLLSKGDGVLAARGREGVLLGVLVLRVRGKEVRHLSGTEDPLVDGERGAELVVAGGLDSVEELQGVGLAVIGDEIVGWLSLPDSLDDSLAWLTLVVLAAQALERGW